jgi:hypothetical protein
MELVEVDQNADEAIEKAKQEAKSEKVYIEIHINKSHKHILKFNS